MKLITEGVDTNGDSIISYGEAEAVTSLDITNYYRNYVTDITGIEAIKNLTSLTCLCNVIDELDGCRNKITFLEISENNGLQGIPLATGVTSS